MGVDSKQLDYAGFTSFFGLRLEDGHVPIARLLL